MDTTEQRNFIEIYGFSCISNATPPFAHCGSVIKNLSINAGDTRDMDSIPGSGRYPGVGNGNPIQYFCRDDPMDRGAPSGLQAMGSQRAGHD